MKAKNLSNILLSLIFCYLSYHFLLKFKYSFDDTFFFPLLLSTLLTLSFLTAFIIEKKDITKINFKTILIILLLLAYLPLIHFFSFRISNLIFLFFLGVVLYERKKIKLLLVQIISFILLSELITHYILRITLP